MQNGKEYTMYLPKTLNDNARLNPLSKDARTRAPFGKVISILRSRTRRMTKAEEQAQGEMFFKKFQEQSPIIGVQSFQGFTGGHIVHQKK